MFVRPYRVKSNAAIRGSDRKRLRSSLQQAFPHYDFKEPMTSIIPNKEEINVVKLYTHKGENVTAYFLNKNPLFFEVQKYLYPSLYFVWQHLQLLPCLTTHQQVISKLGNGADLMLPGIVIPSSGGLPLFEKGAIVAINAEDNLAPLAIGIALMSSQDILNCEEKRGKSAQILHVFGDHLWHAGEKSQPPKLDPPVPCDFGDIFVPGDANAMNEDALESEQTSTSANQEVEATDLTADKCDDTTDGVIGDLSVTTMDMQLSSKGIEEESNNDSQKEETVPQDESAVEVNAESKPVKEEMSQEDMDELLNACFMTALKTKLKDAELPIIASTFYRSKVLSCCPPGKFLEIKKTSYKKLNKYLKHLVRSGLIHVKELTKGNDSIMKVNRDNAELRSFKPIVITEPTNDEDLKVNTESQFGVITQRKYEPPEISILYGVNAATLPLFNALGYSKGTIMNPTDIRKAITSYVKENELINGRNVTVDPILHDTVCGKSDADVTSMSWEELFKRLLSKMQVNHQLQFKGTKPIIRKGAPPNVEIMTQQRTGNKKVTLVKNLESFLIEPQEFADTIRKLAQASTSVTLLPGSKPNQPAFQVLIQGNQVFTVESLLTGDTYRIPRKYLKGLELAPKGKGKQRR